MLRSTYAAVGRVLEVTCLALRKHRFPLGFFMRSIAFLRALLPLTVLLLSLVVFHACGKNSQNQIVKDIVLQSSIRDEDIWVSLSASFMVGNLSFTAITMPIRNPKNPDVTYGEISFLPTLTPGFNEIKLSLNLSDVAKIQGGASPTIPNGTPIPIGGIGQVPVIEILIPGTNVKIYFALDQKTVLLGVAAAIKEFDVLSGYIGGANIFLGFNIQGVLGSAGLFTSRESGKSGIGLFVDLSSVINTEILNDLINNNRPASFADSSYKSYSSDVSPVQGELKFLQTATNSRQLYNLKRGMDSLNRKTRKMNLP